MRDGKAQLQEKISSLSSEVEASQQRRQKLIERLVLIQKDLIHRKTTDANVLESAWVHSVADSLTEVARVRNELTAVQRAKEAADSRILDIRAILVAAKTREEAMKLNLSGDHAEDFIESEAIKMLKTNGGVDLDTAQHRHKRIDEREQELNDAQNSANGRLAELYAQLAEEFPDGIDGAMPLVSLPDTADQTMAEAYGTMLAAVDLNDAALKTLEHRVAAMELVDGEVESSRAKEIGGVEEHWLYPVVQCWIGSWADEATRIVSVQTAAMRLVVSGTSAESMLVTALKELGRPVQLPTRLQQVGHTQFLLEFIEDRDRQQQIYEMAVRRKASGASLWSSLKVRSAKSFPAGVAEDMDYTSRMQGIPTGKKARMYPQIEYIIEYLDQQVPPSVEQLTLENKTKKAARKAKNEWITIQALSVVPSFLDFLRYKGMDVFPASVRVVESEVLAVDLTLAVLLKNVMRATLEEAKEAVARGKERESTESDLLDFIIQSIVGESRFKGVKRAMEEGVPCSDLVWVPS